MAQFPVPDDAPVGGEEEVQMDGLVAKQPKAGPVLIWAWSRALHRRRLRPLAKLMKALNFTLFKTILPPEAIVGTGVQVRHYGLGTVIHPNTTIGDDVVIWHGVTIGSAANIGSPHRVMIGDQVRIGAGAIIMNGKDRTLNIGAGARIGAGAIVVKDVPAGATVLAPLGVVRERSAEVGG